MTLRLVRSTDESPAPGHEFELDIDQPLTGFRKHLIAELQRHRERERAAGLDPASVAVEYRPPAASRWIRVVEQFEGSLRGGELLLSSPFEVRWNRVHRTLAATHEFWGHLAPPGGPRRPRTPDLDQG